MKIAAIDIGTNTVLMLIGKKAATGEIEILADEHAIARLGEGVDKTRKISDEAYSRFENILTDYTAILARHQVDRVCAFATSAMRDAINRDEIIEQTKKRFGISIELLSGDDESRLSFRGSLFGRTIDANESIATIDIGGGSTEVSFGEGTKYLHGKSIDIGAVRIKERYLLAGKSLDETREIIRKEFDTVPGIGTVAIGQLIAVAGTPTSLAAMKAGLKTFDSSIIDGMTLSLTEVTALLEEIISIPPNAFTKAYPVVPASRADILPSGAIILEQAMKALKVQQVTVSTRGLRYGVLLREFDKDQ